jgi:hypothetical protein
MKIQILKDIIDKLNNYNIEYMIMHDLLYYSILYNKYNYIDNKIDLLVHPTILQYYNISKYKINENTYKILYNDIIIMLYIYTVKNNIFTYSQINLNYSDFYPFKQINYCNILMNIPNNYKYILFYIYKDLKI